MKKLIILLCLFGGVIKCKAQADSFVVENRILHFSLPKDWILEEKKDSLQGDTTWNVILRYAISSEKLNGVIALRIEKRPVESKSQGPIDSHWKTSSGITYMGASKGGFLNMERPKNKCKNCNKKYFDVNVYYLNDELDLVAVFSGGGRKIVLDSLRSTLLLFREDFFTINKETINSFRQLVGQPSLSATVFIAGIACQLPYDTGWIPMNRPSIIDEQTPVLKLTCFNSSKERVVVFIDPVSTKSKIDRPDLSNYPTDLVIDKNAPLTPKRGRAQSDTANFNRKSPYKNKYDIAPTHNYKTVIQCFVVLQDSLRDTYLVFSLCTNEEMDQLLYEYYDKMITDYALLFLSRNNLKAAPFRKTDPYRFKPNPSITTLPYIRNR